MATRQQVYDAILAADKAGRKDDVVTLGQYLKTMPEDGPAAPDAPATPTDDSAVRGFALGASKPFENVARAIRAVPGVAEKVDAVRGAVGLGPAQFAGDTNDAARANNSRTGMQMLGNIAGTAPTLALPGGAFVQGGVGGALLSDARDAKGVALDTVGGALASKVGEIGMRGLGKVIAPKVAPVIERLNAKGIPTTIGQIGRASGTFVGNVVGGLEDALSSVVPGINIARNRGVDALNRSFTNNVLKPLGIDLPDNVATGHDAVAFAQDRVRDAFQAVTPMAQGVIDNNFGIRTQAILARAKQDMPAEYQAQLDDIVQAQIANLFDNTGAFNGKRLGRVSDRLDKIGAGLRKDQDTWKREIGDAVGAIREQVFDLVGRNNPQAKVQIKAANAAHANLVRLEKAAASTAEGVATPGQFKQAVINSDRSMRKRGAAGGRALAQQDAKDAAAVLPSKLGESGTTPRAVVAALLGSIGGAGGAAGGVAGAAAGLVPAVATGAALSIPYTKVGQKTIGAIFSPGAKRTAVRNFVERTAVPVGAAAPALIAASRK